MHPLRKGDLSVLDMFFSQALAFLYRNKHSFLGAVSVDLAYSPVLTSEQAEGVVQESEVTAWVTGIAEPRAEVEAASSALSGDWLAQRSGSPALTSTRRLWTQSGHLSLGQQLLWKWTQQLCDLR